MNKCIFIIVHFGKFNNYFPLFLKTCEANNEFNWLIITDDKEKYNYPKNVRVIYKSFEDVKKMINSKFDFKVCLEKPYKLCDYRPAYGYIFNEYIKEYKFWGYCDTDMVLGNLSKLITDDLLEKYDKLFALGHMTLYKNNELINKAFMLPYKNKLLYKEVYSTNENRNFDEEWYEENINRIFLEHGFNVYQKDYSANPIISSTKFILTKYDYKSKRYSIENYEKFIYIWDDGNVYRIRREKNKILKEEFLYMHLQQRKMKIDFSIYDDNIFQIIPNKFIKIKDKYEIEKKCNKMVKKTFNLHSIRIKYRSARDCIKRYINAE